MDRDARLSASELVDTPRVRAWLEVREPLERQLGPLGRAAIDRLHPRRGERILDIGCGVGGTPLALARAVGPSGRVVAIDVLSEALDVLRVDTSHLPNVELVHGDAGIFPFAPASFDAAFSRFGVMFFHDADAAFRNIRRALRPDGRLGFVCWRGLSENELDERPLRAVAAHLPPQLVAEAGLSEHLRFADPDVLNAVLPRAGYVEIDVQPHEVEVRSGSLCTMVDVCSRFGSLGKILRDRPDLRHHAVRTLKHALEPLDGPDGPALRAATWLVTARSPA